MRAKPSFLVGVISSGIVLSRARDGRAQVSLAPPPPPAMPPPPSSHPDPSESTRPGEPARARTVVEPVRINLPEPAPELAPAPPPGPGKPEDQMDYTTRRYEPAGFPLIGGDSDVGFQFGAVATLSHFGDGVRPYLWNMDVVASTSIKDGPKGVQFVQQSYLYNGDFPGFMGGRLRVNPQVQYQRTINMGYFGLGDASSGSVPANYTGPSGRYFEWIDSVLQLYVQPRYSLSREPAGPWFATAAAGYRYMDPTAYADSKLARDSVTKNPDGSPVVRGLQPLSVTQLALGTVYDSRDNETFVHRGAYAQLGVDYQQGVPTNSGVRYGEAQALLQVYRPIGPFVLAMRGIADFQFGNVPFYDLFMSGPFGQSEAIGGSAAIRGVPIGRYGGEIKLYGTTELRSMFIHFHLIGQKVTLGADALFDVGRSWLDYSFRSPLDGHGVGLKYGVGGGIYVLWGQAAIFRIDAAYSPDAAAENPSFPIGIYVNDGVCF